MLRAVIEEAITLTSIALFAATVAVWAQIFAAPMEDGNWARQKNYPSHRLHRAG